MEKDSKLWPVMNTGSSCFEWSLSTIEAFRSFGKAAGVLVTSLTTFHFAHLISLWEQPILQASTLVSAELQGTLWNIYLWKSFSFYLLRGSMCPQGVTVAGTLSNLCLALPAHDPLRFSYVFTALRWPLVTLSVWLVASNDLNSSWFQVGRVVSCRQTSDVLRLSLQTMREKTLCSTYILPLKQ